VSRRARQRQYVLAAALVAVAAVAAFVLAEVVGTVFFAVTVAYVLVPVRHRLVDQGVPRQWAAAAVASGAFGLVLAVIAPLGWVLYRRRRELIDLIGSIPQSIVVPLGEFTYTLDTSVVLQFLQSSVRGVAVGVAAAAPVIALELFLFAILLYALLLRPGAAGRAVLGVVPSAYHDVPVALNRRVRETLYGIYVLQAATAAGTFVIAFAVFAALGYSASFTLAVVAGFLQFVPVVGPGLLVGVLAVVDLVGGMPTRAVLVAVLGAVFVSLAPDAIIRPRLASRAAHLPTSLYFIGFTGGLLTVGAIGFIAGPLVVALLVEVVELLSDAGPEQRTLEETGLRRGTPTDDEGGEDDEAGPDEERHEDAGA
jgi:predicted PurR-regulated permease PerM